MQKERKKKNHKFTKMYEVINYFSIYKYGLLKWGRGFQERINSSLYVRRGEDTLLEMARRSSSFGQQQRTFEYLNLELGIRSSQMAGSVSHPVSFLLFQNTQPTSPVCPWNGGLCRQLQLLLISKSSSSLQFGTLLCQSFFFFEGDHAQDPHSI